MEFLLPLAGLALLAVPAILLLYFLKVRRPEVRVSTLMFWRPFVADRQANAPWQRLRASLLLALQLLAALALALALVRPGVSGAIGIGGTTVVMLDASASMQATDIGPSRFEAAVARARDKAHQLGPGQEMAVILTGQHAEPPSPPPSDVTWTGMAPGTQVVAALITPGDALAIDNAAFLVTGSPPARKVLLVTEENGFLQRALKLRPGIDLTIQKKADYKPGTNYDLYVFDGWVPAGKLPDPALVVAPLDGNGPIPLGNQLNPGLVLPVDPSDPITQDVVLKDVHVLTAARATVPSGWRTAIAAVDDPLLLIHEGEPRIAELTFDVHHSDLPLRAAFPI